ncbi:hypothetical protein ParKJ_22995 [Paraburkholderia fungorum]|uniref:Uncharacterized protein n=1 Tax=Paraburkholderia fungorum TaxID=134537 RepID=A0AAP5UVW3_9BURK|nr:hypothetical protein [Paraburkholderia fungorum]MDT8840296.1 hypothetical protein [Paraburkholderia fungorum]
MHTPDTAVVVEDGFSVEEVRAAIAYELVTRTGRRYPILEVKLKALICFVLPHDAPSKITCSGGTGIDAMRHDRHA